MITTKTPMTLMHFHDFYYLLALETNIRQIPDAQFRHSVVKLAEDVDAELEYIAENMALRVFTYLFAACLGESRHARYGQAKERFARETLKKGRNDLFANVTSFAPTKENISALVSIFAQEWRAGYGGKAWKQIAEALLDFGKTPAIAWLDHVVDLEHNNGTAFNKEDAESTIFFLVRYPDSFSNFLDYKFNVNILEKRIRDRYDDGVTLDVTPAVHKLVKRWSLLSGKKMPSWLRPSLDRLTEYNVIWGSQTITCERKWHDWIGVENSNSPDAAVLSGMTGLDDLYPPKFTQKQLKAHVNKCYKKAKELSGDFWSKGLASEVKKAFDKWYTMNSVHAKTPKAKKTYAIIPVDVKVENAVMQVIAHIPYQKGYGEEINGETLIKINGYFYSTNGLWKSGHAYGKFNKCVVEYYRNPIAFKCKELEALLD